MCPHELSERETACADGYCPLCQADRLAQLEAENATLKEALEDAELEGKWSEKEHQKAIAAINGPEPVPPVGFPSMVERVWWRTAMETLDALRADLAALKESQLAFHAALNRAFGYTVGGPNVPGEFLAEVAEVLAERDALRADLALARAVLDGATTDGFVSASDGVRRLFVKDAAWQAWREAQR